MSTRLLVTASRRHRIGQTDLIIRAALVYAGRRLGRDTVLVDGGAPGGDEIAHRIWRGWELSTERHPADWSTCGSDCPPGHRRLTSRGEEYCPLAGHRRNQDMVNLGADLVVALPRGRSTGTLDCAGRALRAGIEVWPPYVVHMIHEGGERA